MKSVTWAIDGREPPSSIVLPVVAIACVFVLLAVKNSHVYQQAKDCKLINTQHPMRHLPLWGVVGYLTNSSHSDAPLKKFGDLLL